MAKSERVLTAGQRAYEERRAAKAGMSLDRWLGEKDKREREAERARQKAAAPPKQAAKPGYFARLLERLRKPL